jgi:hypothetical protein
MLQDQALIKQEVPSSLKFFGRPFTLLWIDAGICTFHAIFWPYLILNLVVHTPSGIQIGPILILGILLINAIVGIPSMLISAYGVLIIGPVLSTLLGVIISYPVFAIGGYYLWAVLLSTLTPRFASGGIALIVVTTIEILLSAFVSFILYKMVAEKIKMPIKSDDNRSNANA